MSSLFFDTKKESYRAIRAASHGASISLSRGCDEYVATFNCATSVASVLGDRALSLGDGLAEYRIPVEELHRACLKLAQKFSIALIDVGMVDYEVRFVLLWKIDCMKAPVDSNPAPVNLDEY
jgi:hypothetical protein